MSDQLPLFGAPQAAAAAIVSAAKPLHRRDDSAGAKLAARRLVESGRQETHDAAILAALGRSPWATSLELGQDQARFLAEHGVRDRTAAARRLKGLLERRLVIRMHDRENPSIRPCRLAGSKCIRWALAGTTGAAAWLTDPTAIPVIDRGDVKTLASEALA